MLCKKGTTTAISVTFQHTELCSIIKQNQIIERKNAMKSKPNSQKYAWYSQCHALWNVSNFLICFFVCMVNREEHMEIPISNMTDYWSWNGSTFNRLAMRPCPACSSWYKFHAVCCHKILCHMNFIFLWLNGHLKKKISTQKQVLGIYFSWAH